MTGSHLAQVHFTSCAWCPIKSAAVYEFSYPNVRFLYFKGGKNIFFRIYDQVETNAQLSRC